MSDRNSVTNTCTTSWQIWSISLSKSVQSFEPVHPGGYNLAFAFASLPIDQLSLVEGWGGSVVGGGGARPPPT